MPTKKPSAISAEAVEAARKEAGLTTQQAADILNVAQRTWQRWEKGTRNMTKRDMELFRLKTSKIAHP